MKTYSLAEVAEQVLPPEWTDGERWLARRLNRGQIRGYRVGRIWRMTEQQVEDLIDRFTNNANGRPATPTAEAPSAPPISVADGLSRRSRRRLRTA
ncbi:DNA-binding protein [Mycobacterium avium]|uniref:DNA-binding protein n=1 Tax=Mycobacterium avium TaxID=1764 RepID=UPI000B4AC15D|nr:DNA-binding protein [Mycobacterium avium]QBC86374.1 DNA-binding protein [Mycobacterium avium subsp. hominissuis]